MENVYLSIGVRQLDPENTTIWTWWLPLEYTTLSFANANVLHLSFVDDLPDSYQEYLQGKQSIRSDNRNCVDQFGNSVDLHELRRIHEDPLNDLGTLHGWSVVLGRKGRVIESFIRPDHTQQILSRHNLNVKHMDTIMQAFCAFSDANVNFNSHILSTIVMPRVTRDKLKRKIETLKAPVDMLCRLVQKDICSNAIIRSLLPAGEIGQILRNHHEEDLFLLPGEQGNFPPRTLSDRMDLIIDPALNLFIGRGDVETARLIELQALILTRSEDSLPDAEHFLNVAKYVKHPWNPRLTAWPVTPADLPAHSTHADAVNRPDPVEEEE